jgi:hypothetical protein
VGESGRIGEKQERENEQEAKQAKSKPRGNAGCVGKDV